LYATSCLSVQSGHVSDGYRNSDCQGCLSEPSKQVDVRSFGPRPSGYQLPSALGRGCRAAILCRDAGSAIRDPRSDNRCATHVCRLTWDTGSRKWGGPVRGRGPLMLRIGWWLCGGTRVSPSAGWSPCPVNCQPQTPNQEGAHSQVPPHQDQPHGRDHRRRRATRSRPQEIRR
jgi:hypothetical protein